MQIVVETLDGDKIHSSDLVGASTWAEFRATMVGDAGIGLAIPTPGGDRLIPWTAIKQVYESKSW